MTFSDGYDPYYGEDSGPMRRANDEWRHDPERREAARARLTEISDAFEAAHAHLKQAMAAFDKVGVLDATTGSYEAIPARCQRSLRMALIRFDSDAKMVAEEPTDTYLGNAAAFGYAAPKG